MISLKKIYESIEAQLKEPTISEKDVDPKELEMGIEVELEHVSTKEEAKIIALHHLAEDPHYYTKLTKMEKGFNK